MTSDNGHGYPTDAGAVLRDVFGHDALRPSQERALDPILEGRDAVVVMPTGSGKSLCFQLPGLLAPGLTLVVSPLISLMKDQVDTLRERGIEAATLNSAQSADQQRATIAALHEGRLKFLYVAPERLGHGWLLEALAGQRPARIAVDEAHCASMWGHDFRPDYLRIGAAVERLGRPQTLAFTATATPIVRDDIVTILGLRDPAVVVTGFDRPNLGCRVVRCRGTANREQRLAEAVSGLDPTQGAALVYVGSRRNAERAAEVVRSTGLECGVYHAGLDSAERSRVQDAFMSGELPAVAATNAFGMGIDRADVRRVIHFDLPGSLEAYYQEIGRAGRDGLPSQAVLLFSEASVRLQEFFLTRAHPEVGLIQEVFERLDAAAAEGRAVTEAALSASFDDRDEQAQAPAAVYRLVGLGLVVRMPDGTLQPMEELEPAELLARLDLPAMRQRRHIDEAKLQSMIGYARGRRCRRDTILDYFEADRETDACGRCDVCSAPPPEGRTLDDEDAVVLRKLLSGVARARGRVGKNRIVLMLAGSRASEVAGTWLEQLSTYGLLAGLGRKGIALRLEGALDAGLIDVVGDRYPVLALSRSGWEVLKGATPPPLDWPASGARPTSSGGGAATTLGDLEGEDAELAERLRVWRAEQAGEEGVPAYRIFNNRSIEDLVRRRPTTLEELQEIHGFGPMRAESYGQDVLDLLAEPAPERHQEAS